MVHRLMLMNDAIYIQPSEMQEAVKLIFRVANSMAWVPLQMGHLSKIYDHSKNWNTVNQWIDNLSESN